jgi:hypothetical protein
MIEKIIHVYYGKTLNQSKYLTHNKTVLPNYQFMEWDDNKLLDFCKKNQLPQNNIMIRTVCKLGGFFIDSNYEFLKNIDIFLDYKFLSVFDSNYKLKFYGSKKENKIINKIFNKYRTFSDKYILEYKKNKIINPIYLYPQKKIRAYGIIEVNKNYIFGANHVDSSWVFDKKITDVITYFKFNKQPYSLRSNKVHSQIRPNQKRNILVVIAHPDDDMLFFGELLIYRSNLIKVICVTCLSKDNRDKEFINVMKKLDVDYEMWDISDIKSYADSDIIRSKLTNAIKGFDIFFTHSLSGETGHPTHILINKIMFDIVPQNLFVANPFRQKNYLLPKKSVLLDIYNSQRGTIRMYRDLTSKEDYLRIK